MCYKAMFTYNVQYWFYDIIHINTLLISNLFLKNEQVKILTITIDKTIAKLMICTQHECNYNFFDLQTFNDFVTLFKYACAILNRF